MRRGRWVTVVLAGALLAAGPSPASADAGGRNDQRRATDGPATTGLVPRPVPRSLLDTSPTATPPSMAERFAAVLPAAPAAVAGTPVPPGVRDRAARQFLVLGRPPTPDELHAAVSWYATTGAPIARLADLLLHGAEYEARWSGGDTAFVNGLYVDVLGRTPDPAGRRLWLGLLSLGATRGEVAAWFTDSPQAVARTGTSAPQAPALPAALTPRAAPPGGVLALGDSVMLGAAGALQQAVTGIEVDAAVSRHLGEGTAILQSRLVTGRLPGTVVIHLGTNGAVSPEACDAMLAPVADRRVVLVNLKVPRRWEAPNNEVLRACAIRHRATYLDWQAAALARGGVFAGDGYHLRQDGARLYAWLVAGVL